ncbi:type VII secretion protein EsaA [Neobacillus soli]|uniref:type VII secretion protein EsaA n=1 Tax=Neobacillus soli TaxID=220688 RepID=UPI000825DDF5|nr:type VII secretion protein EsaA [Neobacillus soli]
MKKFEKGILLFFVLVLALSSGISYLALNQASKSKDHKDNQKMTVALVNEDQGSTFNGKPYEFGNEFIRNVEKDEKHNWYVVSRGVAESGLGRNVYNMMIVIPNDFSQKALSLDSKEPEKVVLNYKVNASGNSNMKAVADKTASSILGDFNRRIIDVYFASVMGNLHDAQDNISTLVKKEQVYTNIYNDSIHRPLAGYTSQFGEVQSNANLSKDSFKGLQDILTGFENRLGEGVRTGQSYQTRFLDFRKMQDTNHLLAKGYSDQLGKFDRGLNSDDVLQQWNELMAANKAINDQFQQKEDHAVTILSESAALQEYLNVTKEKMSNLDKDLANKLESDMQESIAGQLKNALKTSSGVEKNINLTNVFAKPDKNAQKNIQSQIDKLPTLDAGEIDKLDISELTKTQLKNTIAVTNKYNREFGYSPNRPAGRLPLAEKVEEIKNDLKTNGVTIIDSVNLPETKKKGQDFTLSIPAEFAVNQVLLTLPNHDEMDYTEPFLKNGDLTLPATDNGPFTVKLKVNLKDTNTKLDVFQPITWGWNLVQKDVTDVDTPVAPPEPEVEPNEGSNESENSDGLNNLITDNPIIKINILNNHITHQVMSPLTSGSTSRLMNGAIDTVSDYQRMQMLYELYFGLGMEQFNRPDLEVGLSHTNLKDIATEESLYYLFNKQDIVDVLANYVAGQISEEVRQKTEELKGKIDEYTQLVNHANQNSKQLADRIKQTTEQAGVLNTNLSRSLQNLASWREDSLTLQDEQSKLLINNGNEQSLVLSLDDEFNSLLAGSQSLVNESKGNLHSAEGVYQTFTAIDNQAETIKNSGVALVKQAGDLSSNLTNKLIDDQSFADNFAGVLANSRIGTRPNENLLSFLSNPVETKNAGVISVAPVDVFTPYFVVLICFIIAFFTAYVISTNERKRLVIDSFAEERTLVKSNLPISVITASIGIVEGVITGVLSGYFLQISQGKFMLWTGLITLVMLTLLLAAAYLLRQLKMVGMFILLASLSLYLFLTRALGLHFDQQSFASKIQDYSPLHYIEKLVTGFADGATDNMLIIFSLLAISVISLVGHLLVFNRFAKSEEIIDDGISEAH